jgi:hypothetical protein
MKKKLITLALCAGALGSGAFFATTTEAAPKCPNGKDYTYISRSPEQCAAIRFVCDPGLEPFFNECGCGCRPIEG